MGKRILLFILTNILVVVTISILTSVLGVNRYLTANGIDYQSLMILCLIWGMAGSLISLAMSRMMAKWMLGITVIDQQNPGQFASLVEMVKQLSRAAQLPAVPEIGIYESAEVNAFATGPTKSRSLVAFSTGILRQMKNDELAGVVGHELSHIKNGDMVTMTLLQGVVNAFVMFFSRVIAWTVSQNVKEENRRMVHWIVVLVLDIVLTILGSLVVRWFSRQREFKADAGSAQIGGREKMVAALRALQRGYESLGDDSVVDNSSSEGALATLKISGKSGRFGELFATHPSLEERIERLANFA